MNYINNVTGTIVSIDAIREAHPNMSIPDGADLTLIGYRKYKETPQPTEYNQLTHDIRQLEPVEVSGVVEQRWEVYALDKAVVSANLAMAKTAVWDHIMTERDRRASLGVKVGSHWFHSDQKSRTQQLGLVLLGANIPAGLQWKTLTTTPPPVLVTMTPELAQSIVAATAASDTAIFTAAEQHRIALESSSAPQNYDFSVGWPTSIEDEEGPGHYKNAYINEFSRKNYLSEYRPPNQPVFTSRSKR